MKKRYIPFVFVAAAVLLLALAVPALAEKPDFSLRVWADGQGFGTKVIGELKGNISDKNVQSLDKFFVILPPAGGELPSDQVPVGEAAPGPGYNGGRWWVHTAQWTEAGLAAHGSPLPLLTKYGPADDPESILFHEALGHITISEGSPPGGPPDYFLCPLLPLKE